MTTLYSMYMSPFGEYIVGSDGTALTGLWRVGQKYFADEYAEKVVDIESNELFLQTKQWLDRYVAGEKPGIGELPLAPKGSEFRQIVWKLLCEIPYGKLVTYGYIAQEAAKVMGRESMSAQAVGGAVGHNPISIIIPCHRVVGADGSLTGYGGGLPTKVMLLKHEGADLSLMTGQQSIKNFYADYEWGSETVKGKFLQKDELPSIPELPDPFLKADGSRVTAAAEWPEQREYLKEILAHYLYGHMPENSGATTAEVVFSRPVYSGRAVAETVKIKAGRRGKVSFQADIIRPAKDGKVPVFTWNQFAGYSGSPIEEEIVCQRGYAIVEFSREQIARDGGGVVNSAAAKAFPECDWGAIAMWAWGHSRLIDYLLTTEWADEDKIVATGHSRGGKVALCAAIYDERIALCAPNASGCGGAGCFRFLGGRYGENIGLCETAGSMNDMFSYWWSDAFAEFGSRQMEHTRTTHPAGDMSEMMANFDLTKLGVLHDEDRLPFDMHIAKALIAPRALITTEGLGDTWANTFGTQVTWRAAQEVFDFLGVPERNAIHFREGGHDFQAADWHAILDFCDDIFFDKKSKNNIVSFSPAEETDPQTGAMMQLMDWRGTKLHYSWENPL